MSDDTKSAIPASTDGGIFSSISNAWHSFRDSGKPEGGLKPITGTIEQQRAQIKAQADIVNPARSAAFASVKTLGDATASSPLVVQQSKGFKEAYASGDYNNQPTKELQTVALKGYIQKIAADPAYRSLDLASKKVVTASLYSRTVKPLLVSQGINPPTFDDWVRDNEMLADSKPKPNATFMGTATGSFIDTLGDATTIAKNIVHSSLVAGKTALGMKDTSVVNGPVLNYLDRVAYGFHEVDSDYSSNFKPLGTVEGTLANMAGSIPFWVAATAAIEATGGGALAAGGLEVSETASKAKGVGELTKQLLTLAERAGATGKKAQLAVRTMTDAAEIYGTERASDKTPEQAAQDAAGAAIIGPVLHGVFAKLETPVGAGKVRVGQAMQDLALRITRKGGAKVILGGEGMVNAVSDVATKMQDGTVGEHVVVPTSRADRIMSLVKDDDPNFIAAAKAEIQDREALARTLFPEKAAAKSGSVWRDLSNAQRAKVIAHLDALQKQGGAEMLPLSNPVAQTDINAKDIAGQVTANSELAKLLNAISGDDKGVQKAAAATTKAQAKAVVAKHGLVNPIEGISKHLQKEAGAVEPPAAPQLPRELSGAKPRFRDKELHFEDDRDRALYIVARDFKKSESDGPDSLAHFKYLAWLKENAPELKSPQTLEGRQVRARVIAAASKTSDETVNIPRSEFWGKHEASAEYTDSVKERSEQIAPSADALKEYEPQEGAWAQHGAGAEISALRMSGKANESASLSASVSKLIDKNTDSEDFVYLTRKFLPNSGATKSGKIFFENPEHHLLYIATRPGMDKIKGGELIQQKAYRILRAEFGENAKVARERADWLHYHVQSLKDTPHYDAEGNIFNSTKLEPPADYTKSMRQLHREVTAEDLQSISDAVKQANPELAASLTNVIKGFAQTEKRATSGKQALKLRQAAKDYAIGIEGL